MATEGTDGELCADLLWDVNRLLRERLAARSPDLPRQRMIYRLMTNTILEPGITLNELARRSALSQSAVSVTVVDLERAGLLRKERDPDDRRLVRLYPTARGISKREEWRAGFVSWMATQVRGLPAPTMTGLVQGLTALRDELGAGARAAADGNMEVAVVR